MSGVTYWVAGRPAPQGSKTRTRYGGMKEASKYVAPWRDSVAWMTRGQLMTGLTGPVRVTVEFHAVRPAGHYGTGRNAAVLRAAAPRFPTMRPDLDKLLRSTLDGLKTGGAYRDDSQVCAVTTSKVYGTEIGAMITIEPMDNTQ
jgi:crossover junction endodeoxyribonuclease RusA